MVIPVTSIWKKIVIFGQRLSAVMLTPFQMVQLVLKILKRHNHLKLILTTHILWLSWCQVRESAEIAKYCP